MTTDPSDGRRYGLLIPNSEYAIALVYHMIIVYSAGTAK